MMEYVKIAVIIICAGMLAVIAIKSYRDERISDLYWSLYDKNPDELTDVQIKFMEAYREKIDADKLKERKKLIESYNDDEFKKLTTIIERGNKK